jgi:hypothetical protein
MVRLFSIKALRLDPDHHSATIPQLDNRFSRRR